MNPDCTCGHAADEHIYAKGSYHECDVEGCECVCYEATDEEEDG